jgi:hypothetical protein
VLVMEKDFRPFHVKVQCMQLKKLSFCAPLARAEHIYSSLCPALHGWKDKACPRLVNHCFPLL